MALETRLAARQLRPFGEAFAPPGVVFGDAVVLGQVEGEDQRLRLAAERRRQRLEARSAPAPALDRPVGAGRRSRRSGGAMGAGVRERVGGALVGEVAVGVEPGIEAGRGL